MFETHTIHTHTKNVFLPTSKSPDVHSEWTNLGHMPTSEPISVQENGLCDWLRPIKIHPDGWGGGGVSLPGAQGTGGERWNKNQVLLEKRVRENGCCRPGLAGWPNQAHSLCVT